VKRKKRKAEVVENYGVKKISSKYGLQKLNLALYVVFHWHTNDEAVADLEAKELV
jgi:hypothetical protein